MEHYKIEARGSENKAINSGIGGGKSHITNKLNSFKLSANRLFLIMGSIFPLTIKIYSSIQARSSSLL